MTPTPDPGAAPGRPRPDGPPREFGYRELVDRLPTAVYTCDAEGRIRMYNEAAVQLWGRRPEPGESWCGSWRIFQPDGTPLPLDQCPMAVALTTGRPVRGREILVQRPDGSRRHVLPHPEPILDDQGRILGAVNMLVDVTDQRRAAEELAATQQDLAAQEASLERLYQLSSRLAELPDQGPALDTILAALVELHGAQSGTVSLRDPGSGALRLEHRLGFGPAELEAMLQLPAGPDGSACSAAFALRERVAIGDIESDPRCERYRALARAAGFRAIHSVPVVTGSGDLLGVLSVQFRAPRTPTVREQRMADLCARKAAVVLQASRQRQALRESEAMFRTMADHAPVLIWLMGPDGCEFVNRGFLEFVGRPFEEVRGRGWQEALHPDDQEWSGLAHRQGFSERKPWAAQYRLRRADGEYRWVQTSAVPRVGSDGAFSGFIGCTVDITDIKRSEIALKEADLRKDDFLATLAHELRNPLAPLRTSLAILRHEPDRTLAPAVVAMMERQLNQLVRMVDDLLELSRLTLGKVELRRQRVELSAVVQAAVEGAQPALQSAGRSLTVCLPSEPLPLDADAARLTQVFSNLLHTALRFTADRGAVQLTAARDDGHVVVTVRDARDATPAAPVDHGVDLYGRMGGTIARAQEGLGIGLTLVRRLVELHGGRVQARSAGVGAGGELVVRLPLLPTPDGPSWEAPNPVMTTPMLSPRCRVLIVDDNPDSADSLGVLLRLRGATVEVVHDGPAALGCLESFQPSVALLDLGMPGMDGFAVAERIREQPRFRSVVLVAQTGWGTPEFRERGREVGFSHHLVKPVDLEALVSLLAQTAEAGAPGG